MRDLSIAFGSCSIRPLYCGLLSLHQSSNSFRIVDDEVVDIIIVNNIRNCLSFFAPIFLLVDSSFVWRCFIQLVYFLFIIFTDLVIFYNLHVNISEHLLLLLVWMIRLFHVFNLAIVLFGIKHIRCSSCSGRRSIFLRSYWWNLWWNRRLWLLLFHGGSSIGLILDFYMTRRNVTIYIFSKVFDPSNLSHGKFPISQGFYDLTL